MSSVLHMQEYVGRSPVTFIKAPCKLHRVPRSPKGVIEETHETIAAGTGPQMPLMA
jgi:hypothetical protein